MDRTAPSLMVLPAQGLVPPLLPPPLEAHAATRKLATSQPARLRITQPCPTKTWWLSNLSAERPSLRIQAAQQPRNVELGVRILRIRLLECLGQDHSHGPVPIDLVVGRDDVPGRP